MNRVLLTVSLALALALLATAARVHGGRPRGPWLAKRRSFAGCTLYVSRFPLAANPKSATKGRP